MDVQVLKEYSSARHRNLLTVEQAITLVVQEYKELLTLTNPTAEQKSRLDEILHRAIINKELNKALNKLEAELYVNNTKRFKVLFFEF
jgi:ABC-type cobalamin transport system ATPase subunit